MFARTSTLTAALLTLAIAPGPLARAASPASPQPSASASSTSGDVFAGRVLPFKVLNAARLDAYRDGMVRALVTVSVTGGTPADWAATAVHIAESAIVKDVTFATAEVMVDNPWGDRPPTRWKKLAQADFSPIPGKSPWSDKWAITVASRTATPAEVEYDELEEALVSKYADAVQNPDARLRRVAAEARRFIIQKHRLPASWKPDAQGLLGWLRPTERSQVRIEVGEEAAESMKRVGNCLVDETRRLLWKGCMRPDNSSYPDPLAMMPSRKAQ